MPRALEFAMTGVIGAKVYVVGGVTSTAVVTNNQVYNPDTNTWSKNTLARGTVRCRKCGSEERLSSRNSWKSLAADPTGRNEACNGSVNGLLYVAGGSNGGVTNNTNVNESFSLLKNKWTTRWETEVGDWGRLN